MKKVWTEAWTSDLPINRHSPLLTELTVLSTRNFVRKSYLKSVLWNLIEKKSGLRLEPVTLLWSDNNNQKVAYSTPCSQAVTHPSTNGAQHCLTSVIRRELVCSMWYGRRQERRSKKGLISKNLLPLYQRKRMGLPFVISHRKIGWIWQQQSKDIFSSPLTRFSMHNAIYWSFLYYYPPPQGTVNRSCRGISSKMRHSASPCFEGATRPASHLQPCYVVPQRVFEF